MPGEIAADLSSYYRALVKAGDDSVRAAWRFGQRVDSYADQYTRAELADAIGLSAGTLYRYVRFYKAYQRPELAVDASHALETADIGIITELQDQLSPIDHGRPYAGRRYRYRCQHCQSTEVQREEFDPETGAAVVVE